MKENIQNGETTYNNAKLWQIGFFALNNAATNAPMFLMMQYAYYTQNVLGLAAVVIGLIATLTRVFDAITDPIVGFMVDKTNGKFGRLRPYMVIGNLIIVICLIGIFNTPTAWSTKAKYIYTTLLYFIYILGYTCQTICTKAGQPILTNNPKQRPLYSGFDGIMTQLLSAGIPLVITTFLGEKYSVGEFAPDQGLLNPALWKEAVLIISGVSILFTILAIIGIWGKDRTENFGSVGNDVKFRDYIDIIKNNKPIVMLIVAASSEKLANLLMSGVLTLIFANVLLNYRLQGVFTSMLMLPLIIVSLFGVAIARKVGIKKSFTISTWASMVFLVAMYIVKARPEAPWLFLGLYLAQKCVYSIATASIIPMIADCTDYENYRSGKFASGMMSTMFSFVDKAFSSISTLIIGIALSIAGVGKVKIPVNTFVNERFNAVMMICFCVIPIITHIIAIIAMKYYDLDKEKMEEVQRALAERKNQKINGEAEAV